LFAAILSVATCFLPPSHVCTAAEAGVAWLIPADAGLCLEAQDLDDHVQAFTESAIYGRITRYPPVEQWAVQNRSELERISTEFQRNLGVGPQRVLRGLLGESAALAVWPPSTPGADDGPALVVTKAADSDMLRRLIDALCDAQRRTGKLLPNEQLSVGDRPFEVRVIQPEPGKPPVLIAMLGQHGVMTNHRPILRQVIALYMGHEDSPGSLADSPVYRAARQRISQQAAVTLFVHPRRWDDLVALGQQQAVDAGETANDRLPAVWSRVQYVVGSVEFGDRIAAEAYLELTPLAAANHVDELAASFSGAANYIERIPAGALVAFAGRLDVGRLTRLALAAGGASAAHREKTAEMSRAARGILTGVDLFDDILAGLGPDLGAYLTAAPVTDAHSLPFDLVVGIDTQPRWQGDMAPAVTDVLDYALRTVMGVLVLAYNADRPEAVARLETTDVDGLRVTSVTGVAEFGEGRGPAYALVDSLLLAGSSPRAVTEAVSVKPTESLARNPRLLALANPRIARPSHLLFVDFAGLRELIDGHPALLRRIQEDNQLESAAARQNLDALVRLLSLADALAIHARVTTSGVGLSLAVKADADP
jgi:hypothetical protein